MSPDDPLRNEHVRKLRRMCFERPDGRRDGDHQVDALACMVVAMVDQGKGDRRRVIQTYDRLCAHGKALGCYGLARVVVRASNAQGTEIRQRLTSSCTAGIVEPDDATSMFSERRQNGLRPESG